jgi:hypothetical protein
VTGLATTMLTDRTVNLVCFARGLQPSFAPELAACSCKYDPEHLSSQAPALPVDEQRKTRAMMREIGFMVLPIMSCRS